MKARDLLATALGWTLFASLLFSPAALADNPPTVTIEGAADVGVTAADLSGHVNPQGAAGAGTTYWHFELSESGEPETFGIYGGGGEITGGEAEEDNPVVVTAR